MSQEETDAFYKYIFEEGVLHYCGNDRNVKRLIDMRDGGIIYSGDKPDFFILKDNHLLIVEHFEFDCYPVTERGGSSFRLEDARITKRENAVIPKENESVEIHDIIRGEPTYQNYIQNATRSFTKHYTKIDLYISNLKAQGVPVENMDIEIMFFIVDVSPLGSVVLSNKKDNWATIPVVLALSSEFLELLEKSPRVNYVLACSEYNGHIYRWLIDRKQLNKYRKKTENYSTMEMPRLTPHVLTIKRLLS
jgi:hypothetical protein